ncbi:MAG: hypothetical protein JNK37_11765 [Verrucomicrobiales bacterium]|nr:hypothetical protein [Verrucomicrobiales bacterium]
MQKVPFTEAVRAIRRKDDRFDADAYHFLRDALDFTVKKLRDGESEEHRHVSGPELLHGLRDYALKEFGPLSATVLESWGVTRCEDIGTMVFQLIEVGAFGKSDEDCPQDFSDVFDFDDAFREPFRPQRLTAGESLHESAVATPARSLTPQPAAGEASQNTLN